MPLGSSRGNSRRSTPSTSASVTASASSSPSQVAGAISAAIRSRTSASASATTATTTTTATINAADPSSARGNPASVPVALPSTSTTNMTTVSTTTHSTTSLSTSSTSSSSSTTRPAQPTASSSSTSLRSGFLSRLSLPFKVSLHRRSRNIADFHILCDEPHKKYGAGDPVRGTVVLVVVKPLRLTHLVVTLHGFVRVLKDPAAVAKVQAITTLPPGGSSSRPHYHGNGFASLFQDEQVLCGEGRLEPGRYEFKFDLVFPDKGLPSSIDFERGTISYMITAVLTKPTSIKPTVLCERKIALAEKVNVGVLPPPGPQTLFYEPISKRTRKKKSSISLDKGMTAGTVLGTEIIDLTSETDSLENSVPTNEPMYVRDNQPPLDQRGPAQSDVRSEVSGGSVKSTSTAPNPVDSSQLSQISANTHHELTHQQAVDGKTITATIELLKGGCLPGDTVSVRVTVQHTKRVKSMTGVVVTLFRQGKIDYAPSTSLFSGTISKEDARRLQRDEMYPRSRTGLSGLSVSSTGSISMFRKDLDQTTAPLIIDPVTLQASITVPVRVPDDSFPTIKGVPGDMISFKYQVEVIVDLGGNLSKQLQGGQTPRLGPFNSSATDQSLNIFSARREANIVETTQLKREKGVISVSIESVVGTIDSSLSRKYAQPSQSSRMSDMGGSAHDDGLLLTQHHYPHQHLQDVRMNAIQSQEIPSQGPIYSSQTNSHQPYSYYPSPPPHPYPPRSSSPGDASLSHAIHGPAPLYISPPQFFDRQNMSEKDRVRQAQIRLLPSRPAESGSAPDEDDIYDAHDPPRLGHRGGEGAGPSAPTEEELTTGPSAAMNPAEDKQERERRRLMEEASAPPEFPEDMERRADVGSAPIFYGQSADAEPTAPVLNDDDDNGNNAYAGSYPIEGSSRSGIASGHGRENHGEQLPAYQR